MYAFDTTETAHIGRRSREWSAVGQTEDECVREMSVDLDTAWDELHATTPAGWFGGRPSRQAISLGSVLRPIRPGMPLG